MNCFPPKLSNFNCMQGKEEETFGAVIWSSATLTMKEFWTPGGQTYFKLALHLCTAEIAYK